MHTFAADDGTVFHYNPDGSGDVRIQLESKVEFTVPADDLLAFVAHLAQREKLAALEQMSPREVLGMKRGERDG